MHTLTLQAFFKYFKIDLSGGSISKRQVLSTVLTLSVVFLVHIVSVAIYLVLLECG